MASIRKGRVHRVHRTADTAHPSTQITLYLLMSRYEVAPTVVNFTRSLLVSFAEPLGEITESGLSNTKGFPADLRLSSFVWCVWWLFDVVWKCVQVRFVARSFGKRKVVKITFIPESLNYWQLNIQISRDLDNYYSFYSHKFKESFRVFTLRHFRALLFMWARRSVWQTS